MNGVKLTYFALIQLFARRSEHYQIKTIREQNRRVSLSRVFRGAVSVIFKAVTKALLALRGGLRLSRFIEVPTWGPGLG